MMSKKDYVGIAKIIKENSTRTRKQGGILYKFLVMSDLIDMFKGDNPRFDEDKFFEACIE